MGLRLVRRNCPHCLENYMPELSQLKVVPEEFISKAEFRRGAGCAQCQQTGFIGRMPVSELLAVTEPFREAVLKRVPTSALEEIAVQQGMRTLWQNGLYAAITGQTTLEEMIRMLAASML
jgi:type IV pilus assembly protein PilB